MSEQADQSYLLQPPITLVCPPELKSRLMLRLSNWATDAEGKLDAGIQVHVGRRSRDDYGSETPQGYITLAPGVFVLYGEAPFTGNGGQPIEWWTAPRAYFIGEHDLAAPPRT